MNYDTDNSRTYEIYVLGEHHFCRQCVSLEKHYLRYYLTELETTLVGLGLEVLLTPGSKITEDVKRAVEVHKSLMELAESERVPVHPLGLPDREIPFKEHLELVWANIEECARKYDAFIAIIGIDDYEILESQKRKKGNYFIPLHHELHAC